MHHNAIFVRDQRAGRWLTGVAYHIENENFVNFLEGLARRQGVAIEDDTVEEVLQDEHGLTGLRMVTGRTVGADLYVDSSGFASVLLARRWPSHSSASSPACSTIAGRRRLAANRQADQALYHCRDDERRLELADRARDPHQPRGCVFRRLHLRRRSRRRSPRRTEVDKTRIVRFHTGRFERGWVKNVIAIGNSSGFVEPLEATSLGGIAVQCQAVAESLIGKSDRFVYPQLAQQFDSRNARVWDEIRRFLAVHFLVRSCASTRPIGRPVAQERRHRQAAQDIVDYYRELGPSVLWRSTLISGHRSIQDI